MPVVMDAAGAAPAAPPRRPDPAAAPRVPKLEEARAELVKGGGAAEPPRGWKWRPPRPSAPTAAPAAAAPAPTAAAGGRALLQLRADAALTQAELRLAAAAPAAVAEGSGSGRQKREKKKEWTDWPCAVCGLDNWEQRTACFRCKAPKGTDAETWERARPGGWDSDGRPRRWGGYGGSRGGSPPSPRAPQRGLFSMPARGRYTVRCEHTVQALAAEEAGEGCACGGEWPTPATKPRGYELYNLLGRPTRVVAPMVEQSELSFRLLCKRYGADLCYCPMINSSCFMKDPAGIFRNREYSTCPADTNMVAQMCGHDPETLVSCARELQYSGCKAIDLNLGCPQGIAKRGFYGAFMMDDLPLIRKCITALDTNISIPITAKIRCFPDVQHTIAYAQMVQDAGASIVTVHGRLREQKGQATGSADWGKIRLVKEALRVPVFANGNVWCADDVDTALAATGCDAVMSADTLLWEPRLFSRPQRFLVTGRHFFVTDPATRIEGLRVAQEYLAICATHPTQVSHMKTHIFKMTHHSLTAHPAMRDRLGDIQFVQDGPPVRPLFERFVADLLDIELAELAAAAAGRPPADSAREAARLDGIQPLGNVQIMERCALSALNARAAAAGGGERPGRKAEQPASAGGAADDDDAEPFPDLFD